jgi:hypothetical protein
MLTEVLPPGETAATAVVARAARLSCFSDAGVGAGVLYAAVSRFGRINTSADTESFVESSDHRDREPALLGPRRSGVPMIFQGLFG